MGALLFVKHVRKRLANVFESSGSNIGIITTVPDLIGFNECTVVPRVGEQTFMNKDCAQFPRCLACVECFLELYVS